MHGNRTEITLAIAAAVGGDRKADGLQRTHLALRSVIRVHSVLEGQSIHGIHLRRGERPRGRVLHHIAAAVALR